VIINNSSFNDCMIDCDFDRLVSWFLNSFVKRVIDVVRYLSKVMNKVECL